MMIAEHLRKFLWWQGISGCAPLVWAIPIPTQSLPHVLLWLLEDSESSFDSEHILMELKKQSYWLFLLIIYLAGAASKAIYYFCHFVVCVNEPKWVRGISQWHSPISISCASLCAAGDQHRILCRLTANCYTWKPRESLFYFSLV